MIEQDIDHISPSSLHYLVSFVDCQHLLQRTQLLIMADMDLLTSNESRVCFYVNLYNLMVIHAWFTTAENAVQVILSSHCTYY